jgi:hypothetical protein
MDKTGDSNLRRPTIHCGDLAKPPAALRPLLLRPQWAIWRLTWTGTRWSKPPFQARDPQRHASSADPNTWTDYATAVAAAAEHGDGVSYMLAPDDELAAADIDHVRDPATRTIAEWAQRLLEQAGSTYIEISPSGTGLRIWGTAAGDSLHRKFSLEHGTAFELFRRTRKPLTVTGLQLGRCPQLSNIDRLIDRAAVWGERHKAAPSASSTAGTTVGSGMQFSIEQIEQFVRESPAPVNGQSIRSEVFHIVVGHYHGCGWSPEQIHAHLEQFPDGVGGRYLSEGRLRGEIERSLQQLQKYSQQQQQFGSPTAWTSEWNVRSKPEPESDSVPEPELESEPDPELEPEPELEDEELEEEPQKLDLPLMYCHGDPDPRPLKSWAIKGLMPAVGHGLLSGQWGAGKTFLALELAGSLMTGQPFISQLIKRQCGVLFLAAEGADEIRLRLDALVREKCGGMPRAPFRWYETVPVLLQPGAADKLIAMARQADESLQAEFELPLGLIIIDTVAASAGYNAMGAENDNAVNQALMNVLKTLAQTLSSFVLGVDHFGKNIRTGTRGGSSKEASGDLVLACLGERELSGRVLNTRLAIRKCRGGPQGLEFPFVLRLVESSERDEDGDPITTLVVDWQIGPAAAQAPPPKDPWEQSRRADQRTAALRLKRVLMAVLADRGVDLPASSNGPVLRMVDQEIVRGEFYAQTVSEGTSEQKAEHRRKQFNRALDWAEKQELISVREIGGITYLWLARPSHTGKEEDF